jgi:hypothetical protein
MIIFNLFMLLAYFNRIFLNKFSSTQTTFNLFAYYSKQQNRVCFMETNRTDIVSYQNRIDLFLDQS